jgi:hypothetical protein
MGPGHAAGQAGLPFARDGPHRIAVAIGDIEPRRARREGRIGDCRNRSVKRPVSAAAPFGTTENGSAIRAMAKRCGNILMGRSLARASTR